MMILFLVAAGIIFTDQFSKFLIIANFPLLEGMSASPEHVTVIPGFFEIIHTTNRGGAFGLFSGGSPIFLIIGSIAVLVLLFLYWRTQKKDSWIRVALGLILGGAFGNLIDRVLHGSVTDWLEFFIGQHHWPTFNLADSAIVVGAIIILWRGLFTGKKTKTNTETTAPTPASNKTEAGG